MRFVFLVQASAQMGLGHLMRCQALAQQIVADEMDAIFLLDQATHEFALARHEWQGEIISHDYTANVTEQYQSLVRAISGPVDWLIIDGYQFDAAYCNFWRETGLKIALFDDGVHIESIEADAILNAAAQPDAESNHLFGPEFRLLRREFSMVSPFPIEQRHHLTINFGGSDPMQLTIPVLQGLESMGFTAPIRVITGAAFPALDELKQIIHSTKLTLQHVHDAQDMADVWSHAKLAVSAAGGSQFELAVCQTPAVVVVVADNQVTASRQALAEGWCKVFELQGLAMAEQEVSIKTIAQTICELWARPETLREMQQLIPHSYDAGGSVRVLNALMALS
ncbi:UDP-2,4-diacetamido-2,4,6-trideoxy-beta-L-altropyranose hydrolase [Alteromonas flava]|uniref:UDP-2,4-diacetamido-2,4, 6-trideoxy-beta-L-altropyranose hydrolase n=1 Tax=Alteromonas flava TaxID=2048003 RepID=UPI000C28AE2C|nr:UDP-2,4-diacetamido-2,4,6-trideoxy-beta-L-altropyranose hydrolase [Alteromonas flava]